ncbi:MAG: protein O-mannosyl-transferase family [Planctomycetota bacterium]
MLWYLVVLTGAGVLYGFTCAPGMLWQDSAFHVWRIWNNDIEGIMGLALSHPLYIMIGIIVKHIPFGEFAWRMNIVSAVFGAVAIANLFLLLQLWLGRITPSLIGAVTLAVSWTFWQHSVMAEVYTLHAALMLGELIVLLRYIRTKRPAYLYLLGLVNGLAIANHMWAVFGFACYTVLLVFLLVRRQLGAKHFGIVVLMWAIGALLYEYLVIKNVILSGDIHATLVSAMFGRLWQANVLNVSMSVKIVLENIIFILLNFPTPNLVLLFVGLWALWQKAPSRSFANVLLALLVLYFVFAFRYTVVDRYVFFLPFYCFAAILIGLGADVILKRYDYKVLILIMVVFILLPIPIYFVTPAVARKMYKSLGQRRQRPYRDEYDYFLQPWKAGYKGGERFANEALNDVQENAIIYVDSTIVHLLLYMRQAKSERSDVKIVSEYYMSENAPVFTEDTIEWLMEISPVYVVSPLPSYCPRFLLERYKFKQVGVLWKVVD